MSHYITKEIEVEIDYQDICEVVNDLSSSEKMELVDDCELLNNKIVIDYIDNLDIQDRQDIIDSCSLMDDDLIENHISNLTESEVKDLLCDCGHENLINSASDITENEIKLLKLIKTTLSEKQLKKFLDNPKQLETITKGVVNMIGLIK